MRCFRGQVTAFGPVLDVTLLHPKLGEFAKGSALVDTGASANAVDTSALPSDGLLCLGETSAYAAGSPELHKRRAYDVGFGLRTTDGEGIVFAPVFTDTGTPRRQHLLYALPMHGSGAIILLGRPFLEHCRMLYDGKARTFELELLTDIDPLERT